MNALQRLDLSGNLLGGNLPGGSFDNLGALSKLNLARNNIPEVPVDALSTLTTIQYIDLSENKITTLPRAALGRLPIVFELLLSKNNISSVAIKAFDGMLQLLHLDLSGNRLKTIPVGAFSGLNSMRTLNLSRNFMERTENSTNGLFEETLSLQNLDLSYNRISSIYSKTFPELRWTNFKLDTVDLSNNNLMIITKELLKGTKTVRTLNLARNKITEIRPMILGNLTNLENLDVSHNELSFLDVGILGPPPNLKRLNLEGNYLRKFPSEVLSKAVNLTYLNLEKNRLKLFNLDFMPKIKNGTRVLLEGNAIACDCRLIFLKRHFEELRPHLSNFTQEYFDDFKTFRCKGATAPISEMDENELVCDYLEDPFSPKVPIKYDMDIRSISHDGPNLNIRWRVSSKMDILGFQIEVLDDISGTVVHTETVSYTERMSKVPLTRNSNRICLAPKFSREEVTSRGTLKVNKVCQSLENILGSESLFGGTKSLHTSTFLLWHLVLAGFVAQFFS